MRIEPSRVAGFALLLTFGVAGAQTPPPANPAPAEAKPAPIALKYDRATLETVARQLARRTGRAIVLDSTIRADTTVTLEGEAATLEEALTRVTGPLRLSWRKIYLPGQEGQRTGDQVRAAARALEAIEGTGVIVEDPSLSKATLFMRSVPSAADFESKLRATWPQMRPYYLISNPRAAGRDAARKEPVARKPGAPTPEEFAALERQRMEMFLRLTPEQRAAATAQAMDVFLQADPAVMQEMMQTGMQAWLQSMQRMTPEQRQQLFQRSMQMMQSIPPRVWQDVFGLFRPQ